MNTEIYTTNGRLGCSNFPFIFTAGDGEEFEMLADFTYTLDSNGVACVVEIDRMAVRYNDTYQPIPHDAAHAKALRKAAAEDLELTNQGRFLLAEQEETDKEHLFARMSGSASRCAW